MTILDDFNICGNALMQDLLFAELILGVIRRVVIVIVVQDLTNSVKHNSIQL